MNKQKIIAQSGRDMGLSAAAGFLESTAKDYEEMSERECQFALKATNQLLAGPHRRASMEYKAKAALLRGQAGHIRAL